MTTHTLFDAAEHHRSEQWRIVDDRVMGGVSNGSLDFSDSGVAVFSGEVSTENNGGFSSVRLIGPFEVGKREAIELHLKGDGKRYQLRLKSEPNQSHAHTAHFKTSGGWEIITIAFSELLPTYRGRQIGSDAFASASIHELGILVGNKVNESFRLEIKCITLTPHKA